MNLQKAPPEPSAGCNTTVTGQDQNLPGHFI